VLGLFLIVIHFLFGRHVLFGEIAIAQYLCRIFGNEQLLAQNDAYLHVEIQQWLSYASQLSSSNEDMWQAALKDINTHLACRSVLVGYQLTLADIVICSELFNHGFQSTNEFPHLGRYYRYCLSHSFFSEGFLLV
jgi:glutathione S-transferase